MKKLLILTATIFFIHSAKSQAVYDYLKAADNFFNKGDYSSAAEYYEKYLGSNKKIKGESYDPYTVNSLTKQQKAAVSNKQQATYKLAECYRKLNYPSKASPLYATASAFDKKEFPLAGYWYGKMLRALQNYDAADSVFNSFVTAGSAEAVYIDDAKREIKSLQFIKEQLSRKDLDRYTVGKFTANAEGATYAPVRAGSKIFFTSTRKEPNAAKNAAHVNKIYEADLSNGTVTNIKKINLAQAMQHQGVIALTPDASTMFFTVWSIAGSGERTAKIYMAKKEGDAWSTPVALDNTINAENSNNQQPFVTSDGKYLLFSSNRTGGLGGFDLWYVELEGNNTIKPGTIKNMGAPVNTAYDEQAPYYHAASKSLVFSSNGNIGMGGYDLFASKGTIGNFEAPFNLGHPVNSVKDDMYFTSNGNAKNILADVLFSSDRGSECCLEIYALTKVRPLKQITGLIVDCETKQPLANANITVTGAAGNVLLNTQSSAGGTYSFTTEDFDVFTTNGSLQAYHPNSVKTDIINDDEIINQTLTTLCLTKIPVEPPKVDTVIVMDNIYFEFNKASILPESYAGIDNQIVALMNQYPTMIIEIGGHTDSKGNDDYNLKLSQARANAVKEYLMKKGIAEGRLKAVGYGETKPIAPNTINGKDNPEGRQKNRRTEFKVLSYDYNQ